MQNKSNLLLMIIYKNAQTLQLLTKQLLKVKLFTKVIKIAKLCGLG